MNKKLVELGIIKWRVDISFMSEVVILTLLLLILKELNKKDKR